MPSRDGMVTTIGQPSVSSPGFSLQPSTLRMRSDIARRFAGVSRCFPSRRLGVGSLSFAGLLTFVCPDDAFELAAADGFVATVLTAAHFGGLAGAISMPNISERSSLASTFTPAGLCFFARSEPVFVIKSCESTLRRVKSNSG